ncbi:hypothetical protein HHI36_009205 [Cryptolaemus montrouzieri]|uniref:RNase H type-1 domain-containing protein n=1 Tax=Cryptolaemus montrouzieri TaxID=559131 RepID=A0ABD2MV71_9CUCU
MMKITSNYAGDYDETGDDGEYAEDYVDDIVVERGDVEHEEEDVDQDEEDECYEVAEEDDSVDGEEDGYDEEQSCEDVDESDSEDEESNDDGRIRYQLDQNQIIFQLIYVPSHTGIDGNELADSVAKQPLDSDELPIVKLKIAQDKKLKSTKTTLSHGKKTGEEPSPCCNTSNPKAPNISQFQRSESKM